MRTLTAVCLAFIALLSATQVAAQQVSSESKPWVAQWITSPDATQRDEAVLRFRKVLAMPARPHRFVIHVSADNQFVLYVNRQRVGSGPSRSDLHQRPLLKVT
jgi:alpha-L-rhamnosidase